MSTAIQAIYRDLEYAKSLIKHRDSPAAEILSDESWTMIDDDKSPVEDMPEFKSSRNQSDHKDGRLKRLSKKFNLPVATTALSPFTSQIRALKEQIEQRRDNKERPSEEVDVAEVRTIYGRE